MTVPHAPSAGRPMTGLVLSLLGIVVAAIGLAEVLLKPPTGDDRMHLAIILAAPAVVTAAVVPVLRRWVSTRASVAGAALAVALLSLALGAGTSSAASNAMFLSDRDYRLFLVVLLVSCGIALVVGSQLARPLAGDIARLGAVADHVAAGHLDRLTGVTRRDEVGKAAAAIDGMIVSLREAEAERQRQHEARATLLTSLGHDLRTPLAAMRAAVESLQDGVAPDPPRYLGVLASHVDNIETLLEQMLDFARIEGRDSNEPMTTISLAEVVDEAIEVLRPLADLHEVKLVLDADGSAPIVARATDVGRLVRNLVDNAIRYTPPTSTVTVAVRTQDDGVELVVSDQGAGFPAEVRSSVFEPFVRADSARDTRGGHAGLGLAICRAIVEAHGGSIAIADSEHGVITVALPARPAAKGTP